LIPVLGDGAVRVDVKVLNELVVYMWSGMSNWEYLFNSVECLTVSKALLKSRARTITNWSVVRRLVIVGLCRIVTRAAVVEPDGRKAN